jgi:hypothetical protein
MSFLLPRLTGPSAESMLDALFDGDDLKWPGFDPTSLPEEVRFASTGGSAADPLQLRDLRAGLVAVAEEFGFGTQDVRAGQAKFDAALGAWLVQHPLLKTGEALRDDVWSFIGVAMAPDIVNWRFGKSRQRYLGGIRNTFQRLWMRARVLDRGEAAEDRWGLLDSLTEDALVQITERPSIGADSILSRELAEAWVRAGGRYGRSQMEDVMRLAILRLRIRNEIRSLSMLPRSELGLLIDQFFDSAAESLGAAMHSTVLDQGREKKSTDSTKNESEGRTENASPKPRKIWSILRVK